ncbi:hypothetical protein FA10DRAFT_268974 [Acaromyces ingoldii]|uniref:Uncharacterized protein n=1 Tax=Acaromyces ingoldii TaxID=215250 RepID=A0A316YEU4_9BASI|nr:hypothetical protein FA10DRAFT_268974 [Acaromyces ingoldii]PWN87641.1 hypothetical protein FA10DRAFT_268974 [Acaromyces ingoldii]
MKFAAAALIAALAGTQAVSAINVWATFCANAEGTDNCSTDFQVSNPGCFSVSPDSAKYVKFHADGGFQDPFAGKTYSLIVSPQGGCNCQSNKQVFPPDQVGTKGPNVIQLNDGVASQPSYRFISGGGDDNNC